MSVKPPKLNKKLLKQEQEKLEAESNNNGKFNWVKTKAGDNWFHILPPWPGAESPWYEVHLHYIPLPSDDAKKKTFKCAKPEFGSCVLCDNANSLKFSDDEDDKKKGKLLAAKKTYLYNVVVLDKEKDSISTGIFSAGPMVHNQIFQAINFDVEEDLDPCDYKEGLLLCIRKTGQGLDTEYNTQASRKRINTTEIEDDYENLPKLDEIYEDFNNTELTLVLEGNMDPKGKNKKKEEEDQAEKPKASSRFVSPGKGKKEEVEPTEAPDEDLESLALQKAAKASTSKARRILED